MSSSLASKNASCSFGGMFVHKQPVTGKPGQFKIQICVSERNKNKVIRRILRSFGIAKTPEEAERIMRFAHSEIDHERANKEKHDLLFDASNELFEAYDSKKSAEVLPSIKEMREESRTVEGFKDVYGTLFDEVFTGLLPEQYEKLLKEVVIARIAKPASKRKTQEVLERNLGFATSLTSIYRLMDKLYANRDEVLKRTFKKTCDLLNHSVDMMFFDVSTLYMESFSEDELRKFGYSKDQKFQNTQVVLALATSANGLPIGYKLFPGNTAETKTLLLCIEEWTKILNIGKVFFVADSAMFSFENLAALQERGIEFVVCARMGSMAKNVKEEIFSSTGYKSYQIQDGEALTWSKEIDHQMVKNKQLISGRLIVSYSRSRALKDKADRDRVIEKIKKKINGKSKESIDYNKKVTAKKIVNNAGYIKYMQIDDQKIACLNEEKIKKDEEWDGMHGLFTNSTEPVNKIISYYRRLWVIEESFRINKTDLSIRPVFHFKNRRIHAHISICYMAFALIRYIQIRLEKTGIKLSPERIRTELSEVEVSIIQDRKGKRYRLPSNMSDIAKAIYNSLGLQRKMTVSKYPS